MILQWQKFVWYRIFPILAMILPRRTSAASSRNDRYNDKLKSRNNYPIDTETTVKG